MLDWSNKKLPFSKQLVLVGGVVFLICSGWLEPRKIDPRSVSEATVEEKIRDLYKIDCHVELVWYLNDSFSEIIVKVSAPVEARSTTSFQVSQFRGPTGQQWLGLCTGERTPKSFRYKWDELIRL